MRGRLFPVDGDWCEWRQEPPLPGTVLVRIAPGAGGRLLLTGLRVDGAPTAELLRAIPVGRIEAAANAQLAIVEDTIVATAPPGPRDAPYARPPHASPGGWETTDPSRAAPRPVGRRHRLHLDVTEGRRGRPDVFYRDVAHTYLELAQESARPASELAEANDVPVTTAHRWIKEARRRGFLPPGRPGKTG
jgi:hypothetical protein